MPVCSLWLGDPLEVFSYGTVHFMHSSHLVYRSTGHRIRIVNTTAIPYLRYSDILLVPGKKYSETGIRFLYGKTPAII